jgi:3-hydroxyisobutyrate dehydrogenase-like beta-hydroxyacid dehydrogenase
MSPDVKQTTCGFIGLGSQGAPIAERMIAAGYPMVLWARRPETLEPFIGSGAMMADSVADLGRRADHVGVCVVDNAGVRDVCDQLIPAMRPGARIAIHATIHPETCKAVARQAAERGVLLIDAPVSGGRPAAEAGALTVMVGGELAAVEQARPIFETFGRVIVHLGPAGAGQHAKLINNALMAAHMGLAKDALAAAAALGVDGAALAKLIGASSGQSYGFDLYARLPSLAAFRHGATLLAKDTRLLREILGDEPGAAGLNAVAQPFLDLALKT